MSTAQSAAVWAAYAQQTAFGTPIVDTGAMKFFPVKAGGLKLTRPSKTSDQLYRNEPQWAYAQNQTSGGSLPMDCYFEGLGLILNSAMARASKRTASFVIDSTNNKLYFTEDAGQLTATLSSASYTAHGLAAQIAAQMTATGDTYSCTYSDATGKFTITKTDGSPTNFTLDVATTTNAVWSTIGFTTAGSGSNSYTSGTAKWDAVTHYFIPTPLGRFNVFYVRTGVNDSINFKEDGGGELTATIAAGVYTASELATAVKTALEAPGAATYTVSYDSSTHVFTIASDGATSLALLFRGGTNADASARDLLGFGASDITDSSGALSIAAGTAVYGSVSDKGLTILDNRELKTLQGRAHFLTGFQFALAENDPHGFAMNPTFVGADLADISTVAVPSGALQDIPGTPDGNVTLNTTLNGVTYSSQYFRSLSLGLTFGIVMGNTVGNTVPVKVRKSGRDGASFTFAWDLDNDSSAPESLVTAWKTHSDYGSMDVTQLGEVIRGAVRQSLKFEMPGLRPTGDTPPAAAGTLQQVYNFLVESVSGLPMCTITLVNREIVSQ